MKNKYSLLSPLLTLAFLGLGQHHNGQTIKGLFFLFGGYFIILICGLAGLFVHFYGMVAGLLILVSYKAFACFDAYRGSENIETTRSKTLRSILFYFIHIIIYLLLATTAPPLIRYFIGFETFEIPTSSMYPTLEVGDKILATNIEHEKIQLGDIITFHQSDGQIYLGRVLALPNQDIKVKNDQVIFENGKEKWEKTTTTYEQGINYQNYYCTLPNGKTYYVRQVVLSETQKFGSDNKPTINSYSVPEAHVFIMSDQRSHSLDSRNYGAIKLNGPIKKVNYIWWSHSIDRVGLKLD